MLGATQRSACRISTLAFPPLTAPRESLADWLAEIPTLRIIQSDPNLITDDFLRYLARLGKLHMLHVDYFSHQKEDFPLLHRSERERTDKERPDRDEDITHLVLFRCPITDAAVDTLLTLKKTEWFELDDTQITSVGVVRLAALPALTRLGANHVTLTAADLQNFKKHTNLKLDVKFDLSDSGLKAYRAGGVLHLLCKVWADEDENLGKPTRVVRELNLSGSPVTDAGLDELKDFQEFSSLDLSTTKVTDAGLARIAVHPHLRWLALEDTSITDAGLKHLSALSNLEQLDLQNTGVTDGGFRHLEGMSKLQNLNLRGTGVGDAGLKHLALLPRLEDINLRATRVTDAGLREVRAMPAIRKLDLRETEISDAGLVELKSLTKVREIYLWDTNVTEAGVKGLEAALPDCMIRGRAKRGRR